MAPTAPLRVLNFGLPYVAPLQSFQSEVGVHRSSRCVRQQHLWYVGCVLLVVSEYKSLQKGNDKKATKRRHLEHSNHVL